MYTYEIENIIYPLQDLFQGIFDQLDEESWYPVPTPGIAFFLALTGGFGHIVNSWLAYSLTKTWPELDAEDVKQFYSDSEGESSEASRVDDHSIQ